MMDQGPHADLANPKILAWRPLCLRTHAWFPALRFRSSVSVSVKPCPYCRSNGSITKKVCTDTDIPQYHARRGVNKRHADTEDVLSLYAILDAEKVAPRCAAVNLARLPPTPSSSSVGPYPAAVNDTVALLQSSVSDIQQQMAKVVAKLDELKAGQPEIRTVAPSDSPPGVHMQSGWWQPGPTETVTSRDCLSVATGQPVEHPDPGQQASWAVKAQQAATDPQPFRLSAPLLRKQFILVYIVYIVLFVR